MQWWLNLAPRYLELSLGYDEEATRVLREAGVEGRGEPARLHVIAAAGARMLVQEHQNTARSCGGSQDLRVKIDNDRQR